MSGGVSHVLYAAISAIIKEISYGSVTLYTKLFSTLHLRMPSRAVPKSHLGKPISSGYLSIIPDLHVLGGVDAEPGADGESPERAPKKRLEREHRDLAAQRLKDKSLVPVFPTSSHQLPIKAATHREFIVPSTLQSGATATSLVWAAWSVLVSRLTGSKNVKFGATNDEFLLGEVPCAGEAKSSIVPIKIKINVDEDQDTEIYIASIRATQIAFAQQKIHQINGDAEEKAIFETVLVFKEEGVSTAPLNSKVGAYALVLIFGPEGSNIKVQANYDPVILGSRQTHYLMAQLQQVLQQVGTAGNLPRRVHDIQCVSREDLQQIGSWNASIPESEERCVHDLISAQARRSPDAPAISAWDGEMDYGELDLLSTRLAIRLMQFGIGPNFLVPLCFDKSMWTSVAMVAVMKTGAGFILMDVDQPRARL